ncbi:MAG TPA: M48 family metalloprotease [Thermoplasmata archaeon]|nr:M48 family metalloprotease [Thermoplasmata archaeon]
MLPPLVAVLYVPVVAWVAAGIGLVYAYRRSAPVVVLRLAATFLALWALLATTVLVWVLANGGWTAVTVLLRAPWLLFAPRFDRLWLFGGLGAFVVFVVAFAINQLVGRAFLRLLRPRPMAWPGSLPRPTVRASLLAYPSDHPEAFSFTLVEWAERPYPVPRRREVILLSTALLQLLSTAEREAAIAHELGHIRGFDGRYLTFVRTFARLMRWDPVLAYLARALTRREEYRADGEAAALTGRPLALARAIYKVVTFEPPARPSGVATFLGRGNRLGRREALERIRRLVALAESGAYPESGATPGV